ncbi:bacterio-opsin activator domain-containing protein [Haladaptatus salinisoli]|uniref:bacterio-opsin activator domain-containing protein n=1 Tax=Haladaptatus salinisoli TaxID=2884876 RepID=UPI001D0B9C25|nr:bacterio-opsin activator domain-containing protein [Haladaptatus salinisoli]
MSNRKWKQTEYSEGGVFEKDLYDTLPDVFYAIDRRWRPRRWNDRLPERTGYTDEEIAEMHPLEFIADEEREEVVKAALAVFERGETRTYDAHLLTKDGDRIPYEFNGSPITDEEGTVVGLAGTGRNISERKEREQELQRYETLFETVDDGIYALDSDLRFVAVNDAFASMTGYDRDRLLGMHASVISSDAGWERGVEQATEMVEGSRKVAALESELVRADGTLLPVETRFTFLSDEAEAVVGVTRDVTERRERERTLRQQRDELRTLDRINSLIRELVLALASTATRDEVERTVCTRLADSNLYRFAWIGERDRTTGSVAQRSRAGIDDGAWDIIEAGTEDGAWERPASVVLRTGTPVVVDDIATDSRYPESVQEAIADTDIQSGIAVPLAHGKTIYGVLVVYATRPGAFSEREAAGFEALGELVGFVIDAVESKRLLHADRVVELEFRLTDETAFFTSISAQFDATCVLQEMIPSRRETLLEYVHIEGIPEREVVRLAEQSDAVRHVRLVGGTLFEITVAGASPVLSLIERGASITKAVAEDGEAHIVAELPPDADVRGIVEALEDEFPDSELVGKRERERPARTVDESRAELEVDLTERQSIALRSAYVAGYFDWPRESTAEEVADALGVTSATLHQHVRKAEKKLLAAFFEE